MTAALASANLGGIDPPFDLPPSPDLTSIYYTDGPSPAGWSRVVRARVPAHGSARLAAKVYKCQLHRQPEVAGADLLVWADASVRVADPSFVSEFRRLVGGRDDRVAVVPHPDRRSPAEEYEYILRQLEAGNPYLRARYDERAIRRERDHFARRHDLAALGLYAGGVWGIANTPRAAGFLDAWWSTVLRFSILDQAAVPSLLEEHGIEPAPLDVPLYQNRYWTRVHHA